MEMCVNIAGAGISIPKTGFGVNIITGSYLGFRHSQDSPVSLLGLKDSMSLGSKSGTVIIGWISTKWFPVDQKIHPWVMVPDTLVGSKAEIEVVGTLIAAGKVDLKIALFDGGGNSSSLMSKIDIESVGGQIANTKVRGVICKVT
ncbi:MAG: hypothetical protein GY874_22085 [Desulfobacteraceae bacterium]|nr:hypothetical protein [Desulfobacteraceae bacterium]